MPAGSIMKIKVSQDGLKLWKQAIKNQSWKEQRGLQESKKPIIQSIRDYVMLNPDIDDRKINIDYLGNGMEYSIDPIGADPVY